MRLTQAVAIAVVIAVIVAGVALLTGNLPSGTPKGNLLANGGFETADLRGWNAGNLLVPTVESTVVNNGTYGALFETTSNGNALSECTQQALGCSLVNSSTISQDVAGLSVSPNSTLSIALYPAFQPPSTFQMTLDFAPSSLGSPDITIYYVFSASSEQCDAYSQLLVNASNYARAFCLSVQQGKWTVITRSISNDIPSALKVSDLGSSLTLSLSFAGGNSSDAMYVDSVSLRR
jgi:hypothetical protein